MTAPERKAMLAVELDRARSDATGSAYAFIHLCEQAPRPAPDVLEAAATALYEKSGRVAGFAQLLAREDRS